MALNAPMSFEPVKPDDFEAMLALRIRAMRPSLEAIGRFDPERARDWLAASWAPAFMRRVLWRGERVGSVTLRPLDTGALRLDHLYIEPAQQGQGIGKRVMRWALCETDARGQALELAVLQHSVAQRWYERLGFAITGSDAYDFAMRREPKAAPVAVVRSAWQRVQARDWAGFRALLHTDLSARWWTSGERFVGADAFVRVQSEYPEGWSIDVLEVSALADGRVLSVVRVDHGGVSFFGTTVFEVESGLVREIDELWGTFEPPPDWRSPPRHAGWQRFDSRASS
jgi:ribosomal protein S18 acetylase RimI-like enzyme